RREGKTPVLSGEEMRQLLDAIGTDNLRDLRDRALFATLAYAFPRISTALALRVADFESSSGGWTLYLKGKGGEAHRHAVHHEAAEWLNDWLEAAALHNQREAFIFQAIGPPRGTDQKILHRAMSRTSAFEMVKRRARDQGLNPALCTHSFRATGVTAYVEAGGALETAARMAGHADVRTTQLYVRKVERSLQSEVERIRFGK
ncbi:MAG: tyrosine-type recombinase/integrase, partial [Myxococcota bacterium]